MLSYSKNQTSINIMTIHPVRIWYSTSSARSSSWQKTSLFATWMAWNALSFFGQTAQAQQLSLYISAPGVQTAESSGLPGSFLTETFDGLPTGSLANGPLIFGGSAQAANGGLYEVSGGQVINGSNEYGGYQQGNYLSINEVGATMSITFDAGINYFGFLWTAGDGTNKLSFYNDADQLLASYTTDHLLSLLPRDTTSIITAVDGADYYTGNYYGQPTATGPIPGLAPDDPLQPARSTNTAEPYGYLHFLDEMGTGNISRVVIEKGPGGGNFENDNHSVSFIAPSVENTPIVLIESSLPIPEPSGVVLVTAAGVISLLRRRRHLD